ncbi:MAG: zinc-dependent alcohol dehydrogenase family protein [Deltaproteobacteria bacterium]|nr:zinc-dependent alcohol dehydrogenase family protein [Deltaproteobacteria bacterium]MBW2414418.1 zinc-dependent alcohol dehydrogenase family protein [Deltaproteobacteria bacterium]
MRAMVLHAPGPVGSSPLSLETLPEPELRDDEILVDVSVCGICRTDLHVIEGELAPRSDRVVPGHQVVGRVVASGAAVRRFAEGDRVGIAWLHRSCGRCAECLARRENLCRAPVFTGWHVDGGYAERVRVPAEFAYAIPDVFNDAEAAPLLCAGIIGYRALRRSRVGRGERLGLYGFGSSAHLCLQVARHRGAEVYVCTRDVRARELALELGAVWAGGADERPPVALNGSILFAPVGELVLPALEALAPGGTLACAGIHMSAIPALDYAKHLFDERTLTSVTANTRQDGVELLELAAEIPLRPHTTEFPLEDANQALRQLAEDGIRGSGVLRVSDG